jgi:hypothetical protein
MALSAGGVAPLTHSHLLDDQPVSPGKTQGGACPAGIGDQDFCAIDDLTNGLGRLNHPESEMQNGGLRP